MVSGVGLVGGIWASVPREQVAAEGGYGDAGDDGDPGGEEKRSGIEEKRVRRHAVPPLRREPQRLKPEEAKA